MLHGSVVDADEVARVRDIIMFEEPGLRERLVRFAVLLVLASAIATFGLISDSVATVIGAMIVAPLMLPIMGLAFAISIGDRKAVLSSIAVGFGGIATAILVGWLLSMPWSGFNPEVNGQIMARTAPRLIDLCAAIATGLAGAFAMSRRDVSDTLPGVAIAISLVPPLANVGILLGAGRADLAAGSMLLFITNYCAILLAGSAMFGLLGFPRVAMAERSPAARRVAVIVVIVLAVVISVPLGYQTYQVARTNISESRVHDAADAWLAGTDFRVLAVSAEDDILLSVSGMGKLPSTAPLQASLMGKLGGRPVTVEYHPSETVIVQTQ
ncbi:MAG: DUF389 domain-containing protein [Coriobacteriia bacterium]|nr:DUF389 domain-containing protein [Coriobacteriia bacterium]